MSWLDLSWLEPKIFGWKELNQKIARFKKKFCIRKLPGPRKYWNQNIWVQKNFMSKKHWVKEILGEQFVPKKIRARTLQTPSLYLADSNQTPSRHLLDILPTPLRHPPNSSLLYCIKVWFSTRAGGGLVAEAMWWVGGWSPVQNHATSWSNLQDCKISSRAEIPKLDRVWQFHVNKPVTSRPNK